MNERVIFYIDGLNLYNGLKRANLRKYYWLDLRELAIKLCLPNQELIRVKYFTSMVSTKFDEDKFHRQSSYIKAIKTLPDMEVFLGRHQKGMTICNRCGKIFKNFSEKMTDMNIAVEMFKDAHQKNCDTQILVSGDSDLVPVCRTVLELFNMKLVIFFPPYRKTDRLREYCHFSARIFTHYIKKSQLPEEIIDSSGNEITKPEYWK